jgi:hypothetical protein
MSKEKNSNRLFVPLASQPYDWFASGLKHWEIRKYGRQYTEKHVYIGKPVELRRGYSNKINALWGVIERVEYTDNIRSFFDKVPYADAIPTAFTLEEAILFLVESILRIQPDQPQKIIGFKIRFSDF